MLFSVIIPVYNRESLIAKCLDSIIPQIFPSDDCELIIVNDGSTDGTQRVLRTYAHAHPSIHIVSQPNLGCVEAVKRGVQLSKGRYTCFIDSDDYVEDGYFRALTRPTTLYDADIIALGLKSENGDKQYPFFIDEGYYDEQRYQQVIIPNALHSETWDNNSALALVRPGKFIKKDILIHNFEHYHNLISFEDYVLMAAVFLQATTAYVIHRYLYVQVFHSEQTSGMVVSLQERFDEYMNVSMVLEEVFRQKGYGGQIIQVDRQRAVNAWSSIWWFTGGDMASDTRVFEMIGRDERTMRGARAIAEQPVKVKWVFLLLRWRLYRFLYWFMGSRSWLNRRRCYCWLVRV